MRPADDPSIDYKALVRGGYERCADAYLSARARAPATALHLLFDRLPKGASVLDLGCGAGLPIASALAPRYRVTGVDFSSRQIELARRHVPNATFIHADLSELRFPPAGFEAIAAFYVLFHLPRDAQLDLLGRIWAWLKPGGYFLATASWRDEAPYLENDFFGVTMYWTNFAFSEYERILQALGFQLESAGEVGHGFEDPDSREEHHPLLFVRKPIRTVR